MVALVGLSVPLLDRLISLYDPRRATASLSVSLKPHTNEASKIQLQIYNEGKSKLFVPGPVVCSVHSYDIFFFTGIAYIWTYWPQSSDNIEVESTEIFDVSFDPKSVVFAVTDIRGIDLNSPKIKIWKPAIEKNFYPEPNGYVDFFDNRDLDCNVRVIYKGQENPLRITASHETPLKNLIESAWPTYLKNLDQKTKDKSMNQKDLPPPE